MFESLYFIDKGVDLKYQNDDSFYSTAFMIMLVFFSFMSGFIMSEFISVKIHSMHSPSRILIQPKREFRKNPKTENQKVLQGKIPMPEEFYVFQNI